MRRPTRLLLALPATALVALTACAPFHAGAAATVGNARISTDELRTLSTAVLAQQPKDGSTTDVAQSAVQQGTLSELVQLQVLRSLAASRHVTVGTGQIGAARTTLVAQIVSSVYQGQVPTTLSPVQLEARARAVAAAAGVDLDSLATVDAYVTALTAALPVSDEQIRASFDRQPDHRFYDIDVVEVSDQTTAQEAASALQASPANFARIALTLGAGSTTSTTVAAATLEQEAGSKALKVGAVVGPGQTSSGAYQVVLVTGRGTRTLAEALAAGSTERRALQAQAFPATYAALAAELGIHVNPRFGTWSPTGQDALGEQIGAVAAGGQQLSTSLTSPSPSPSVSATTGPSQ